MEDKPPIIDFDGELELVDEHGRSASAPADFSVPEASPAYSGPERRRQFRRKATDRRKHIRFGSNKKDRRNGTDRRRGTLNLKDMV